MTLIPRYRTPLFALMTATLRLPTVATVQQKAIQALDEPMNVDAAIGTRATD